ncbi:MAG: hypothetical protein FWF44_05435 [Defluviitaleaceae bacterium]|nr:hypothetical protein [Defluviitaleaceae bacterium]
MQKKTARVFSIVLYVISGLMLIYAVWALFCVKSIVGQVITQNSIAYKDYMFELTNTYYMNDCIIFFIYAALLGGLGVGLAVLSRPDKNAAEFLAAPAEAPANEWSPFEATETEEAIHEEAAETVDEAAAEGVKVNNTLQ